MSFLHWNSFLHVRYLFPEILFGTSLCIDLALVQISSTNLLKDIRLVIGFTTAWSQCPSNAEYSRYARVTHIGGLTTAQHISKTRVQSRPRCTNAIQIQTQGRISQKKGSRQLRAPRNPHAHTHTPKPSPFSAKGPGQNPATYTSGHE